MTPRDTENAFSVGKWQVHPRENRLFDGDRAAYLEPRVMSVLVYLASKPGKIVSADELIDSVWIGRAHGDHTVYQAIADLRKALGDEANNPSYIETIPKKGYRLIREVSAVATGTVGAKTKEAARSGYRIAIMVAGFVLAAAVAFLTAIEPFRDWLLPAPEGPEKQSIAVLPFINMSDDPGNDFFSDGLTEDIRNLLSRIPGLTVIGRTSSFAFKGQNEDLRVIGETLGVRTLLEGSVRKSGDQVRITAQLIDVSDGAHIWSETYDRTIADIFAMQDELATAIIDKLRIHVSTNPSRGRPTGNWQAYTHYLEARASMHADKYHAEEMLLRATELDPLFAEAWELLAFVYFRQAGETIEVAAGHELTGNAAARALAIDPDLVLARAMSAAGNIDSWSWTGEIAALERALREQPSNLELLHALQYDLFVCGYVSEALNIAERRVAIDPLAQSAIDSLTTTLYAAGRTDEAIALLESQYRLGVVQATWDLGEFYLVAGQDDVAFSYFEAHERRTGYSDPTWVQDWVASVGDPETGQAHLDRGIEEYIAALPGDLAYSARHRSAEWYLYFGYLDRYFELFSAFDLTPTKWTDAEALIFAGTMFRRQGFTAHPKYLDVAEATGIMEVWEQRGPPDFCKKVGGQWICE
jgi:TolB-like protein/DNA-binding winged helix-turn-helix (wHTH) protein